MDFNSSGYLAYKKNKIQKEIRQEKKPISRLSFLFQLFIATFIVMFIIIVVTIMKYSSKVDIEYTKGEMQLNNTITNNAVMYEPEDTSVQQRKIDKRLILIQQEENAPSEAKILNKGKNYVEVIDPKHVAENKKLEKVEKQKKMMEKARELENSNSKTSFLDEIKKAKKDDEGMDVASNVTILSKVLVGRFQTFEEANLLQNDIKKRNPDLSPFVRKIGNVYSVQMGSYQDFAIAKEQASKLRAKGFDVWIYQQ